MNLLTLKKGNKRYDLQINNIKYCIGNDFEEKYNFVNILKEVFLLSKESEYSINNSGQAQVLINDKEIKVKSKEKRKMKVYLLPHFRSKRLNFLFHPIKIQPDKKSYFPKHDSDPDD